MADRYKNLIHNQADGTYPTASTYFRVSNPAGVLPPRGGLQLVDQFGIAIYGSFTTATLDFVFFTEDGDGNLVNLGTPTGYSFTSSPDFTEKFIFPVHMPFQIVISGADGSTNLGVNLHIIT